MSDHSHPNRRSFLVTYLYAKHQNGSIPNSEILLIKESNNMMHILSRVFVSANNQNCPAIYSEVCYSKNSTVIWQTTTANHTHPKKSLLLIISKMFMFMQKKMEWTSNWFRRCCWSKDPKIWLTDSHLW